MSAKFDIEELNVEFSKGLLKKAKHPTLDLYIWNYSERVQYSKLWTPLLKEMRGLVTDTNGNVVARSFRKFFNWEEGLHDVNEFNTKYRVFEKLDGSLGLLFWYKDQWIFSSRGSFTSQQAIRGFEILKSKPCFPDEFNKDYTYVFEIIYPENRIVVDYNNLTDCILLSIVTKSGKELELELDVCVEGLEVVKEYSPESPEELKKKDIKNKEGFVLLFDSGERIKIKFDTYVKLHRQVSNLTVQNILDWTKSKTATNDIIEMIPDEYHPWYKTIHHKIQSEYDRIEECANKRFNEVCFLSRKELATSIKDELYRSVIFKLADKQPVDQCIYKIIETSEFFKKLKEDNLPFPLRDSLANYRYTSELNHIPNSDEPISSQSEQSCVVFDIDGTLALNLSGRSPYDMEKVDKDTINKPILAMYQLVKEKYHVIICTGRSEEAVEKTLKWLDRHSITYSELYFRPFKNREPDYMIKERMWRHISKTYRIEVIFDDRNQVVNHGRKLGLTVLQVADGDF